MDSEVLKCFSKSESATLGQSPGLQTANARLSPTVTWVNRKDAVRLAGTAQEIPRFEEVRIHLIGHWLSGRFD